MSFNNYWKLLRVSSDYRVNSFRKTDVSDGRQVAGSFETRVFAHNNLPICQLAARKYLNGLKLRKNYGECYLKELF